MNKKRSIALVLACAAMLAVVPSGAGSEDIVVTYVPLSGTARGFGAPPATGSNMRFGVGGYSFTPQARPLRIKIVDNNGRNVGWIACQQGPKPEEAPDGCGSGDDVVAQGCSTNKWQSLGDDFKVGTQMAIFIEPAHTGVFVGPTCDGISLGGVLTLDLSPKG